MKRFAKHLKHLLLLLTMVPFVLAGVGSPPAQAAGSATPSGIPLGDLEQHVDDFAQSVIGKNTAGAAVVIVNNGRVVLNKAYGDAIYGQTKAATDDVWEWGSITKLLVWTSAYQLVEQGKLDLDADIRQYLPDGFLTRLKYDTPITFLNLMHHNPGWEDHYIGLFDPDPASIPDLATALRSAEPYQIWEPGQIQAYSNFGAALGGYIVGRISGESFADYVHHHIFGPLGMTHTAILPDRSDNPDVAAKRAQIAGHTLSSGHPKIADNERAMVPLYPAGAATGTASDLARFMTALMDPAAPLFAKPATQAAMESTSYWTGSSDTMRVPTTAHGFWESEYAVRTIGHNGGTVAFSTNLVFAPGTGFGAVVMTNQTGESKFCADLITDLFGSPTPPMYVGDMPDAHDLAGWYTHSRRAFTGFPSQVMQTFFVFTAKDANTLTLNGTDFKQVAPYAFVTLDENGDALPAIIYFDVTNGAVTQIRLQSDDLLPAKMSDLVVAYGGWIILALAIVYALAGVTLTVIGTIARATRRVKAQPAQRLNRALVVALVVAIANNITLGVRALGLASYSDLTIHFIINAGYAMFVPASVVLLFSRFSGALARTKVFAVFTALATVLFLVWMIMWQFFS